MKSMKLLTILTIWILSLSATLSQDSTPKFNFNDDNTLSVDANGVELWYRLTLEYKKSELQKDSLYEEIIYRDHIIGIMGDSISIYKKSNLFLNEQFKLMEDYYIDINESCRSKKKWLKIQRNVAIVAVGFLGILVVL